MTRRRLTLTPAQLRALDEGVFRDRMTEAAELDRQRSPDGTRKDVIILARQALLAAMQVNDGNADRAVLLARCADLAGVAMRLAVEGCVALPKIHFAPGSLTAPVKPDGAP